VTDFVGYTSSVQSQQEKPTLRTYVGQSEFPSYLNSPEGAHWTNFISPASSFFYSRLCILYVYSHLLLIVMVVIWSTLALSIISPRPTRSKLWVIWAATQCNVSYFYTGLFFNSELTTLTRKCGQTGSLGQPWWKTVYGDTIMGQWSCKWSSLSRYNV